VLSTNNATIKLHC